VFNCSITYKASVIFSQKKECETYVGYNVQLLNKLNKWNAFYALFHFTHRIITSHIEYCIIQ